MANQQGGAAPTAAPIGVLSQEVLRILPLINSENLMGIGLNSRDMTNAECCHVLDALLQKTQQGKHHEKARLLARAVQQLRNDGATDVGCIPVYYGNQDGIEFRTQHGKSWIEPHKMIYLLFTNHVGVIRRNRIIQTCALRDRKYESCLNPAHADYHDPGAAA